MPNSGPISDFVLGVLSKLPLFRDLKAGKITRDQYVDGLESQAADIEAQLGSARHLRLLASRYPADFDQHAAEVFALLRAQGFVSEDPSVAEFEIFHKKVLDSYDHDTHRTFIHPDEARLVYFLSMARKPKLMITVGSYYGYWAVWGMPGVAAAGGKAVLIDPNEAVCALAEKNLRALGFGPRVSIRAKKAEEVFPEIPASIDLALLDAAGGKENGPDYQGKGIYGFMVKDIYDRMTPGALLLTHNDYMPGVGSNRLSQPIVERSAKQLERFHEFCRAHFRKSHVAATPDGFGVYLK